MMRLVERVHERSVRGRRAVVLAAHVADVLPRDVRVLDVGCGDGAIAGLVLERRPDVAIEGIDVLVREDTKIPVTWFEGRAIPFGGDSFDVSLLVDVVHHAEDPERLVREAARIARWVVVKDHCADGALARPTLRFMDSVGNARHGVALPYRYWPRRRWHEVFADLGLTVESWRDELGLYPWPASLVFERRLHFVARLHRG